MHKHASANSVFFFFYFLLNPFRLFCWLWLLVRVAAARVCFAAAARLRRVSRPLCCHGPRPPPALFAVLQNTLRLVSFLWDILWTCKSLIFLLLFIGCLARKPFQSSRCWLRSMPWACCPRRFQARQWSRPPSARSVQRPHPMVSVKVEAARRLPTTRTMAATTRQTLRHQNQQHHQSQQHQRQHQQHQHQQRLRRQQQQTRCPWTSLA